MTILTEEGDRVRGNIVKIHDNTIVMQSPAFNFEFSLKALEKIKFGSESIEKSHELQPGTVLLNDGKTFSFRRLIRSENSGINFQLLDGSVRTESYENLNAVKLGQPAVDHSLIFETDGNDTRTIRYRSEDSPHFVHGNQEWSMERNNQSVYCQHRKIKDTTHSNKRKILLWQFPPEPGDAWEVSTDGEKIGRGQWLEQSETSKRSMTKFRLNLFDTESINKTIHQNSTTVRGSLDNELLFPVEFAISGDEVARWNVIEHPRGLTLNPCMLGMFLDFENRIRHQIDKGDTS